MLIKKGESMTFIAKISREDYRIYLNSWKVEEEDIHTYDYKVKNPDIDINIGDVVYLVNEDTGRMVAKCAVIDKNEERNSVKLLGLISSICSRTVFDFPDQIIVADEELVSYIRENVDRIFGNGFLIYGTKWLKEHDIRLKYD